VFCSCAIPKLMDRQNSIAVVSVFIFIFLGY
jgi:hypothetical protein